MLEFYHVHETTSVEFTVIFLLCLTFFMLRRSWWRNKSYMNFVEKLETVRRWWLQISLHINSSVRVGRQEYSKEARACVETKYTCVIHAFPCVMRRKGSSIKDPKADEKSGY